MSRGPAFRPPLACAIGTCIVFVSSGSSAARDSNVFPPAPEREVVARVCTPCHAPEVVVSKRRTPDEWNDVIDKMLDHGAQATDEEQQRILTYLVRFFGPQT